MTRSKTASSFEKKRKSSDCKNTDFRFFGNRSQIPKKSVGTRSVFGFKEEKKVEYFFLLILSYFMLFSLKFEYYYLIIVKK